MTPGTIVDYMGNHGNKDSNGNDNNNSDSSNNNNDSNTNDSSDDDDSSDDNNGNDDTNNDNNDNNSNDDTNKKNNNNINSMSLPPLAAVGYVLMEQKCSLFGLQYKEDPTVVLLYQIAKEALQHQIQDRNSTVERLIKVATKTKKQFKRILEVPNEDKTSTQRKNEKFGKCRCAICRDLLTQVPMASS
ncbi:unnamed protein product [Mucor fragilis]